MNNATGIPRWDPTATIQEHSNMEKTETTYHLIEWVDELDLLESQLRVAAAASHAPDLEVPPEQLARVIFALADKAREISAGIQLWQQADREDRDPIPFKKKAK